MTKKTEFQDLIEYALPSDYPGLLPEGVFQAILGDDATVMEEGEYDSLKNEGLPVKHGPYRTRCAGVFNMTGRSCILLAQVVGSIVGMSSAAVTRTGERVVQRCEGDKVE